MENMQKVDPVRTIFDIPIFGGSRDALLEMVKKRVESDKKRPLLTIFTPNPEQIVQSKRDDRFFSVLSTNEVNIPDGQGIVWALERSAVSQSGKPLAIERMPGREIFHTLLEMAANNEWKVFFLGGKPGSAEEIVAMYKKKYPHVDWRVDQGQKNVRNEDAASSERILTSISTYSPDLVFVAYGAPWQEFWIHQNTEFLENTGVKLAMVVGGAFEYEAGKAFHVSSLVETLHLEWLQRLLLEPWRWRRQLRGLQFFLWVLQGKG